MQSRLNLKSEFVKYVLVLMSGTFLSQLLGYLFSPVITRIYTPEEAAELGLFIRVVSIGAALATLRYEYAIPITRTHSHAFRLYNFALRMVLTVSGVAGIVILIPVFMSDSISEMTFYALIPLSVLCLALINIGTNWSIRLKMFKIISYSKVTNSLVGSGLKVFLGWIGTGYIGLIWGAFVGMFASSIWFVIDFFKGKKTHAIKLKSPRNALLAKEYREFPTINLPHTLMDLLRDLVLALLILELFSKEDFGLYDHSFRMLRLPLIFAGTAIGQVFMQRAAEMFNNKQDLIPIIKKSVIVLGLFSIVPFGLIFFVGEDLFAFVFGENWRNSGLFSEIMVPMFMVNFISSPISTIPMIIRKQKQFFKLSIFGSSLILLSVSIPPLAFNADIVTTLWVLSLSQAAYLVFLIFKIIKMAKGAVN